MPPKPLVQCSPWHPIPDNPDRAYRYAAATDIGTKRAANEDNYFADPKTGIFVVADGMGGHAGGAFASWITSRQIGTILCALRQEVEEESDRTRDMTRDPDVPSNTSLDAYYAVWQTQAMLRTAMEQDAQLLHMGATLVALRFEGPGVHVIHLGDSRAYLIADGEILPLTADHVTTRTFEVGGVKKTRRMLTRVVGGFKSEARPDLSYCPICSGYRLLLCTDGVWEPLGEDGLLTAVHNVPPPTACQSVIQLAMARGSRDNVTALVVDIGEKWHIEKTPSEDDEHSMVDERER